jgi:hypothetical protein
MVDAGMLLFLFAPRKGTFLSIRAIITVCGYTQRKFYKYLIELRFIA